MDPHLPTNARLSRGNLPCSEEHRAGSGSASNTDVLPFSKRPPPPEEYFLRSGDFEAVNAQRPQSHGYVNQHIPAAARAPVFARQAAPTPYGFSQRSQAHAPQRYGHYADLSAPPPPHSLAPVAMGSERSHTGSVASTSAQRAQTVLMREKPSLKWGVMIALCGALLGGVLGLGMDAKRQQARAAAAAEARDAAPAVVTPTLPTQAAAAGLLAAPVLPPSLVPVTPGPALAGAVVVAPAAPLPIAARAPTVLPPSQPISVTPAKPEKHAATSKPAPAKHNGGFVAAKVPAPKQPAPEKAEAPEVPARTAKPKAQTDADKVLEAAIKDTTNTL